ncbi:MAG: autotransporter outer membrane beta-barrel domain-containing protein, partial [Candidatus Anaerobiospirillum merdipullorum]|nr:autotransporter outer membrane beta-barrel domain-containing protein [Candidatus Anaerobiospirillum merdipullorum]
TIRSTPDVAGVWVRYKGGEWDGDDVNQQFNGFELGVDKMITPNFLVGVSASYVKGDGDLDYGSSDNEIYSGAVYFSGFNGGWFVDVVGKVGRVSTDFDLSYNGLQDSGNYDQLGYLLGVETGYRFNFDNFFVEPQVQLTYSYLSDEEVTTSNRDIDFDEQKSFIGRVGFMSGYNFNDLGSVYLHASYYHDFDGDVDASFSLKNADNYVSESDELDSNWGDIGLGADLHLGNATLFVEGARTYGGDIDLEWTANAGVRYTF